jgi:ABC-type multidrug transport system permease subunit
VFDVILRSISFMHWNFREYFLFFLSDMGFSYSVIIENIVLDFNLLYVVYLLFSFSCPFFLPVNDTDRVREREGIS